MKKLTLWAAIFGTAMCLHSCIADEPLNNECDLLSISTHLDEPKSLFYHDSDTLQSIGSVNDSILFLTRRGTNATSLPLFVTHTAGSTVSYLDESGEYLPFINGTVMDVSADKKVMFKVTSEDKMWNRTYAVRFQEDPDTLNDSGSLFFDFEDYRLEKNKKFYEWHVSKNYSTLFPDGVWKNGNPGYVMANYQAKPDEYPTSPADCPSYNGSQCVKLETMDAGRFGAAMGMPIAAGSVFNGYFHIEYATTDALKATVFGAPFKHKPARVSAWLKFEPGEVFKDKKGNVVPNVVDEPDIYIVFYKNHDEEDKEIHLDANDILSNEKQIVALGRLEHRKTWDGQDSLCCDPIHGLTSEWQRKVIEMEYRKPVDEELLKNNGYSLSICYTCSWQGGKLASGAVGTKLYVDDISLECKE